MRVARYVALIAGIAATAFLLTSPASDAQPQRTCRGPASLANAFQLTASRKVTVKRVACATANGVVKVFAGSCENAYAAQTACTLRSHGRWRCQSRLVGGIEDGAPARVSCKRAKATIVFGLTKATPDEAGAFPAARRLAATSPYNSAAKCATAETGTVLTPPPGEPYEIHQLPGVSGAIAADMQDTLVSHEVSSTYRTGLDAQPFTMPILTPILLTATDFDAGENYGIFTRQCEHPLRRAIIARMNSSKLERQRTVTHELFHAFADGVSPGPDTWWEEASATWAEGKVGLGDDDDYDVALQYPKTPLDWFHKGWPYAMSRFVEFLDDNGYLGGAEWPLQQAVLSARANPTAELAQQLEHQKTTLGEQLAAFWGDRLRKKPSHGPQLVPVKENAEQIEVEAGKTQIPFSVDALRTKLLDFKLEKDVVRVEFDFSTNDGYFWGLTSPPNGSRRIQDGEDVSFCVSKPEPPDLEWPGDFRVTFTNGKLTGASSGEILIFAQTDAANCKKSAPAPNKACALLSKAHVGDVLGNGTFAFSDSTLDEDPQQWLCFYEGSSGEARLNLAHYIKETPKEIREKTKEFIKQLKLSPIDNIGDVAGIGTISGGSSVTGALIMAVGREVVFLMVGPGAHHADLVTLGKRIAGQIK